MRSLLRNNSTLINRVSGVRYSPFSQSIRNMVIAVGDKIPSGIAVKVVEVTKEANGMFCYSQILFPSFYVFNFNFLTPKRC
jgi:hypothetical protein